MDNSMVGKISTLISRLEKKRAHYYPADWDTDPLYEVVCELRKIIAESEENPAPALRQIGASGS